MFYLLFWLGLFGCEQTPSYIVEGTVVEVRAHDIVVDHKAIEGFMDAMVMPFSVEDATLLQTLEPGHRILARLEVDGMGATLVKVRVTGKGPAPKMVEEGPAPVRPGQMFPTTTLRNEAGEALVLGQGQQRATLVTFIYTRCPMPEFCPATIARLQPLQEALGEGPRIVAVTLDPEFDTEAVLTSYSDAVGAKADRWSFGIPTSEQLPDLAMRAGLQISQGDNQAIVHTLRTLVLDAEGRLVERYDDNNWPLARVVQQLQTGGPPAPPGTSGTLTATEAE